MDKKFLKLYDEYKDKITDADIKREFDMLYSISQDSNVFLVTVVGNVNAGKSTFFNCLIHKVISEVKCTETTVRPNFVYNSKTETYKTYVRKNNEPIDINSVLNYFFEPKDNDISDQLNIEERTLAFVQKEQNGENDFLFTSFGIDIPFKEAKDSPIVFVDMPGYGGIKAGEKKDPFYDLILRKTDLVILVLNDVLDQPMRDYLASISINNPNAPFIIIINKDNSQAASSKATNNFDTIRQDIRSELAKINAKVDDNNSKIINAFHTSLKIQNEAITHGWEEIVENDYSDFKNFEKDIADSYFSKAIIKNKLNYNQQERVPRQKGNFRKLLDNKINQLQLDIDAFDEELKKVTLAGGNKEQINNHVDSKQKDEVLSLSTDPINGCAKTHEKDRWFWRPEVANVLKEDYLPNYLKDDLNTIFQDYVNKFRTQLNDAINRTQWRGLVSFDNTDYHYIVPEPKKYIFKKCIKPFWRFYNRERLIDAMKNLKKWYLNKDMSKQIYDACKDIQDRYFSEIKEKMQITEKENLLTILQDILKRM